MWSTGNKSGSFPASTWERGHFFMSFHFLNFGLQDIQKYLRLKYREPWKVDWDKNLSLLCEAVDQYPLQWAKRQMEELSVLSSWKEMVKGQIEERISKLKQNFKQPTGKVLQNADVKACLSDPHNKYVFLQADKAPNNILIIIM